jgi:hypothetical protein
LAKQVSNPVGEVLDFSEVRPFEPLDSRTIYRARISNLEFGVSKKGEKKVSCEMTILTPEEVAVEEWEPDEEAEGGMKFVGVSDRMTKASNRKLFREYSLQPQALPFLYQLLKALDPDIELNEAFRFDPAQWIGMECAVKIQNEAYDEQIRPRVYRVYAASKAD